MILQQSDEETQEINSNDRTMRHFKTTGGTFIRSFVEISLRIIIFIIFIQLERSPAFKRLIPPEELWLYKYPPTSDYVPAAYLMPAAFIVPFTIILINYLITRDRYDFSQANNAITLSLGLNGLLTSLLKITVGRPRPDFYYRCYSDSISNIDISTECTGDPKVVNEGRKSFPSGHSSFAFAGFGFVFLYLAAKLHTFSEKGRGNTWRLLVPLLPLIFAGLVAISRTCDYHHHWQDVVVGSVLGMSITYVCYRQYYPSITKINAHKPYCNNFILSATAIIPECNMNGTGEQNPLIDETEKDSKWI